MCVAIENKFIMPKLTKIESREILDSRGKPTIETSVWAGKVKAVASVPSGASTGTHEALELRDADKKRYNGLGVLKACKNVNQVIAKVILGTDPTRQQKIDELLLNLDGTKQKSKLGANAILSVSLAVAKLSALLAGKELYKHLAKELGYNPRQMPVPLFNVINGGVHADSGLNVQEFFIIPLTGKFSDRLRKGAEVYYTLKQILSKANFSTGVGDEGGFAPRLKTSENAFLVLQKAIKEAGFTVGKDFALGVDAAASEFYDVNTGKYLLDGKNLTGNDLLRVYQGWLKKYHLEVIEDGFAEDDFNGWKLLTAGLGKKTVLVGDDLFVTNAERLSLGIAEGMANAILIKVNQIGTITETMTAVKLAQKNKYKVVVSHRSGETNDDLIADLAVAIQADYVKMGSLARGERLAKYNRLMQIEQLLLSK